MRQKITILFALLIGIMPFLTACDSGELQQLIYWGKLWAIVHDITDEEGNPNWGAVTRFAAGEALGFATTGDEEGDAAIDNARVLNNIRLAKDEGDKGWKALTEGDPQRMKYDVYPHYSEAIHLRPNDWTYYNERAIGYLDEQQNLNGAKLGQADYDKASELAKKSGKPEEYLRMLKHREQSLATFVEKQRSTGAWLMGDVFRAQINTYNELYKLTGEKSYQLLKQQAESNLNSPHAERWDGK